MSKSCSNLLERDWTGGQDLGMGQRSKSYSRITEEKRSKSYSRITEEKSSYDQVLTLSQEKTLEKLSPFQKKESYRSTIRNIYTNIKDFSSRTVSALSSSDRILKVVITKKKIRAGKNGH